MGIERFPRPSPPRERTFAKLFPWRSVRRAVMLVLLIVAIVAVKRSMGALLGRANQLLGLPPPPATTSPPAQPPRSSFGVHLAPTLARPSPSPRTPSPPPSGSDPR
jgi:hypothetical protein